MANAPREDNRVPGLVAKSDATSLPVILEADPTTRRLKVTATLTDGNTPSIISGITYDAVVYTNTSTTVDTYQYYSGGTGGTLKATVTITYTDTTKAQISSVVRT